ncbi:mitochondrial import inner membrane translocase subunit tim54 [Kickxella alabastrina]|uniref:Mitochondrial import inner membrane translocase subunit tim54 n=1 Tax=Kickxella alabastrina TaxID=61397 RepID=A0ACC1IJ91_9FUNG|nr:mitochondrial import inner membrane translocase subunit tim54 [Kickxella alabastrina]
MSAGILGTIKKKLPSRNTALFWGTVFGTIGFYQYNKRQSKKCLEYYCKRAEHVANQPVGSLDTMRKVHVYLTAPMGELGTRKARMHWEEYILPVFVAGALDYELTLVNETQTVDGLESVVRGGVHSLVAEEVKETRRKQLEQEEDNEELRLWREAVEERRKENELREYKNQLGREPGETVNVGLWKPEPYPGVMDIVVVGREAWVEAINGISEGATGSLNLAMPQLVKLDTEERENAPREITTETQAHGTDAEIEVTDTAGALDMTAPVATAPAAAEPAPHVINYDRFDHGGALPELPAVAYISFFNLTGWGSLPHKIWNFFHDQQNVELYSRQALQVVFESTKRPARDVQEIVDMGKAEEELPSWENEQSMEVVIGARVAEVLEIYDTQNDNAPFKEEGEKANEDASS